MTSELLSIIVLTKNEEVHLPRLFRSIQGLNAQCCVVDSHSDDKTIDFANASGAKVYQNPFINHAVQFQWALDNCEIKTPWVMRMDADEYLTTALAEEINNRLSFLPEDVSGIILKRQVHFMGKWIRYGGYYPVKLLRIWRNGLGSIEQRWMDEHIVLSSGKTIEFKYDLVDDNLNNLTWWTDKHNHYATREAVDVLNQEFNLFPPEDQKGNIGGKNQRKRWYKENLYNKLPLFLRPFLYFIYRYVFLLGFLDGRRGLIWHFLQGFWYRFLVDAKIFQIKWWARKDGLSIAETIEQKFGAGVKF